MGRREELIEATVAVRAILASAPRSGADVIHARTEYGLLLAERQALAFEGVEDLLRETASRDIQRGEQVERAMKSLITVPRDGQRTGVWTGCGWLCACPGAAGDNDDNRTACDTCGYGRPSAPLRPGSETSRALIAATENAMPTEAWKKAAFEVREYAHGAMIAVEGMGQSFGWAASEGVEARSADRATATKLAALLNRHWGE